MNHKQKLGYMALGAGILATGGSVCDFKWLKSIGVAVICFF